MSQSWIKSNNHPSTPLLVTAVLSAAGFAMMSVLVAKHKTRQVDRVTRRTFPKRRHPVTQKIVARLAHTGKPYVHVPLTALLGSYVTRQGTLSGGQAIKLASVLGATASQTFDWVLKKRFAPPGRRSVTEPSYPSGHTLETTAVAFTIAYVLWREGFIDGRVAIPAGLAIPIAQGVGRLYLDRHWSTDVMGGLLAGISIAAICTAGYEIRR